MGITSLNAALAGLRIAQQQINTISGNVANVGTPGYTRKILPQSSQAIAGVTVGVIGETIIRNVDLNLSRDLWTQVSATTQLDVKKSFLERIQQFHGSPDQEISVAAELNDLNEAFAALSDVPEDRFLQSAAVNQAVDTANKFNELAALITQQRNDAQDEMSTTVVRINDLLEQIAELNVEVQAGINTGQTVAQAQDERDNAILELSDLIEISFFQRGDGVLVIQTNEGVQLADTRAEQLYFDPLPVSSTTYYPSSTSAVYVGDPTTNPAAVDITARNVGGRLGGLIELRDEIFPQQTAQLDELAHKMALRFEAQGLLLFTNDAGSVPADVPPDPSAGPPPTAVPYVGFATVMQVNPAVLADESLIQQGTSGGTVDPGSNVVISRVIENVFGSVDFQEAIGAIDLTGISGAGSTLQEFFGLFSSNNIEGIRDLTPIADLTTLITSAAGALDPPNDQFDIVLQESRLGLGPTTLTVDLSVAAAWPVPAAPNDNAGGQLVDYINNNVFTNPPLTAPELAGYAPVASIGSDGQLVFDTRATFSIDASAGIGQAGLDFFGLADNAANPIAPTDPYFDIQVGNEDPVRIYFEPGDDETDLLTKLQAVPGLAVEDFTASVDGILRLRPGNNYTTPEFGGDLKITGGPFESLGATANAIVGAGTVPDGVNIVSALFSSFSTGPLQDLSPVSDVPYQYETFAGSGVYVAFREEYLGPSVDIETEVIGADQPIDFAQKMITQQSQELTFIDNRLQDEDTLRIILRDQLVNESGVNLDEELSNLIVQQTAYNAAARVITTVDQLFQELLNAV